jgi:preprotein translocase subunit YajC
LKIFSIVAPIIAQASTQAAAATTQPAAQPWYTNQMIPLILLGIIFYVFIFRAKKTQDKKRTELLAQLKIGERVQTIGGIIGTVVKVNDSEVTLKVDESSNTKIRFSRSAVHRVLGEEAETK